MIPRFVCCATQRRRAWRRLPRNHRGDAQPLASRKAPSSGSRDKISAPNAAFANGALVHALNYDPARTDVGHLGVVCLVAPLAMAEAIGGLPATVPRCLGCGLRDIGAYDCRNRHDRPAPERESPVRSGYELFRRRRGAGRVLGLNAEKMGSTLGLALMQMAGSRQVVLSGDPPAKAIYGAFLNQAGSPAERLSGLSQGLGADCDVIGEPAGLYPMIYGNQYNPDELTEELGSKFLLNEVEFKPWPTM